MNLYTLGDIGVVEYAMNDKFSAPFYQRTATRWDTVTAKRLDLGISMCLGLPAGMITTKKLPSSDPFDFHILDGRQRKAAIKTIMNPWRLSEEIQSTFKYDKKKHGSGWKWEDKFGEHVKEWFASHSIEESKEEAVRLYEDLKNGPLKLSGVGLRKAFQDEYSNIGIHITSKTKGKMIEEAAKKQSKSGLLTSKQTKAIAPLWKFAETASGTGGYTPNTEIRDTLSDISYVDWNAKGAGMSNWPFFWKPSADGSPSCDCEEFFDAMTTWIYDNRNSSSVNMDLFSFIDYLGTKTDTNVEAVVAKGKINSPVESYFDELISATINVITGIEDAKLSWCKLGQRTTMAESMKIFQLINDTGAAMSFFELMASSPEWIQEVVSVTKKNDAQWKTIWKQVDEHYAGKGTELRPNHLGLTKWDLLAVLPKQLDSFQGREIIWGV